MLNVFRENLKSLKWLLWVVAISMTLYLGAFFFTGDSGTGPGAWAAKVGGREIPAQDLFNETRSLDQQYQQLFGENYSQMRGSLQLGTMAIERLIQRQIVLDDARSLGITASDEDVARLIREHPAFRDPEGNFVGTERYAQFFSGRPGGVAGFEASLAEDIVIQRWEDMVTQAVIVGDSELEDLFRQRTEKTAVNYAVVPAAEQDVDTEVTDSQIQEWYASHPDDYQRGEGRRIRYVVVNRQAQMDQVDVSETEVSDYYQANLQSYEIAEQRKARHILLRTEPGATEEQKAEVRTRADALLARIQGGEDFAEIAKVESSDTVSAQNGGDLGWFGRGAMVPPFEQAAFGTEVGQLAAVTETQFGFHVIEVTDSREAGTTPLSEVAAAIERNLKVNAAQQRVESESRRLGDAIQSAADLEQVAAAEGLTIETLLVTEDDPLPGLGASPEFLPAVFAVEIGAATSPLRVIQGMAIAAVDEVVPAGVAPLDEVRSEVSTDILNQRSHIAALERAQSVIDRQGEFESSLGRIDAEMQASGDLTPQAVIPGTGGMSAEAREMLFADHVVVGDRGVATVPAGALVWEVTGREVFDPERFESEKETLRGEVTSRRQGLLRQSAVERLRKELKVEINAGLVARFNG